jgi:hypothetical protein
MNELTFAGLSQCPVRTAEVTCIEDFQKNASASIKNKNNFRLVVLILQGVFGQALDALKKTMASQTSISAWNIGEVEPSVTYMALACKGKLLVPVNLLKVFSSFIEKQKKASKSIYVCTITEITAKEMECFLHSFHSNMERIYRYCEARFSGRTWLDVSADGFAAQSSKRMMKSQSLQKSIHVFNYESPAYICVKNVTKSFLSEPSSIAALFSNAQAKINKIMGWNSLIVPQRIVFKDAPARSVIGVFKRGKKLLTLDGPLCILPSKEIVREKIRPETPLPLHITIWHSKDTHNTKELPLSETDLKIDEEMGYALDEIEANLAKLEKYVANMFRLGLFATLISEQRRTQCYVNNELTEDFIRRVPPVITGLLSLKTRCRDMLQANIARQTNPTVAFVDVESLGSQMYMFEWGSGPYEAWAHAVQHGQLVPGTVGETRSVLNLFVLNIHLTSVVVEFFIQRVAQYYLKRDSSTCEVGRGGLQHLWDLRVRDRWSSYFSSMDYYRLVKKMGGEIQFCKEPRYYETLFRNQLQYVLREVSPQRDNTEVWWDFRVQQRRVEKEVVYQISVSFCVVI